MGLIAGRVPPRATATSRSPSGTQGEQRPHDHRNHRSVRGCRISCDKRFDLPGKVLVRGVGEAALECRPHRIWSLLVGLRHDGNIPGDRKHEAALPGIGRLRVLLVGEIRCRRRSDDMQQRHDREYDPQSGHHRLPRRMPRDVARFEEQVKSSRDPASLACRPCGQCKLMITETIVGRSTVRRYRKARAEIMIGSGAWTTREPSNTIGARNSRSCWSSTHTLHTDTRRAPDRWQSQGSLPLPPPARHRIVGTGDCRRLSIHSTYAALSRFGVKGRAFSQSCILLRVDRHHTCGWQLRCDGRHTGGFFHPSGLHPVSQPPSCHDGAGGGPRLG